MNTPIKTRERCVAAITKLGKASRSLEEIKAKMNAKISAATATHEPKIKKLQAEIKALTDNIGDWCEEHRFELCQDRAKSANLITGKIGWRKMPDSLHLDADEEAIIAALEQARLERFVITKKVLNKAAILADRAAVEAIAGLSIQTGREAFYVEPFEQEAKP